MLRTIVTTLIISLFLSVLLAMAGWSDSFYEWNVRLVGAIVALFGGG